MAGGRFGAPAGSSALVSAAFTLSAIVDVALQLSPTQITSAFCQDEARGVGVGDSWNGAWSAPGQDPPETPSTLWHSWVPWSQLLLGRCAAPGGHASCWQ